MEKYIGIMTITAKKMTRLEYNLFRGWDLPKGWNGEDLGYLIEFKGKPNTKEYKGYVLWYPEKQFFYAYTSTKGMSFEFALGSLKLGYKVARKGWNGEGMFIFLVPGSTEINYQPHIDMKTVDGTIVPWLASQSDMLAEDWEIIE